MHLSNSQLNDYARCGKAFELRRIQKAPATYSWWLLGGIAVHEALQAWNEAWHQGEIISDIRSLYTGIFDRLYADAVQTHGDPDAWRSGGRKTDPQTHDWWRENGVPQVAGWANFAVEHDYKPAVFDGVPAIEFSVAALYGEHSPVEVKGFIDLVAQTPDGGLVMIDFKTGSRAVTTAQQMGLYACSMELLGLPRPAVGSYWMTRKDSFGSFFDLNKYTYKYFDETFRQLRLGIQEGIFIASLGDHCRICDVADACFANNGKDSHKFDPSDPRYPDGNNLTTLEGVL